VVNEAEGEFSRFNISQELQSKLRGRLLQYSSQLYFSTAKKRKTVESLERKKLCLTC